MNGVQLERLLAVGELSAVYAGSSKKHGAVAIKLVHPDLGPRLQAELPELVSQAGTVGHAAVPKILELGRFEDTPMLLVELIDGENVASLIRRRRGRIPPAEALRLCAEALEILAAAHKRGVVHGAISGSHVLMAEDGSVHLIGFGEHRVRGAADVAMTSGFVPPELVGRRYTPTAETDLWALMALLFGLVTGRNPRGGSFDDEQMSDARPAMPLGEVAIHAPKPLAALLDRCLDANPALRVPAVDALLAAVRAVAAHPDVQYAHALGSRLAPESPHRPVMGASHMTAPPISPLLGSALRAVASSHPPQVRRATEQFVGTPAARPTPLPPQLGKTDDRPERRPTADSWLAPVSVHGAAPTPASGSTQPSIPSPVAVTLPAPAAVAPQPPTRRHSPPHGVARADTHPALPLGELSPSSVRRRREADLTLGIVTSNEAETESLERCARALADALDARSSSDASADPKSATGALVRTMEEALTGAPAGLACRVLPEGLAAAERTVWSGTGPLARALSALHQAGVETLALLPGLDADETLGLVMLLEHAADPARPAASVINELHDADFAHVLFHASDLMAGLDAPTRYQLELERRRLLALIGFDASFQLEDAWTASHARSTPATRFGEEFAALAEGLSAPTPSGIARTLEVERDVEPERAVQVASSALEGSIFSHSLKAFGPLLREHVEHLADRDPSLAVTLVGDLVRAVRAPKPNLLEYQRAVVSAVLSDRAIIRLFSHSGHSAPHVDALAELMTLLGAEHAVALAQALREIPDLQLRAKAVHHLELGMSGHEQALGELAGSADIVVALELVELLGKIDTLAAGEALDLAAKSSHAVVRLAALGLRDGASGERLRSELRRLLEQAIPTARIQTLRGIAEHEIRTAAPFIALRIKSADFDDLPHEEKRMLLLALARNAPARAEAIALELLAQARLLSGGAHEDSRALAAEALGHIARSEDTVQALVDAARSRWGTSEKVRSAAGAALERLRRRSEAPPPRPSRPPGGSR